MSIDLSRRDLTDIDQWAGLGRLVSSLAHEVINPLSAVLNLSMVLRQLMEEATPPAGRREEIGKYLDDMIRELMRVSRTLSEVVAYSQLSRKGIEASDLNRMSENALALVSHRAKLESLEFEKQFTDGIPWVQCNRSQVEQAILNLLAGACEFAGGGGSRRIGVRTGFSEPAGEVFFEIRSGRESGGSEDLSRRVARWIAEAHGGTVETERESGETAVTRLSLPVVPRAPSRPEV